ncbi:helix-turn-helix domain-containing protein [Trichococcus shcherbakoviae]|uniref:helix-turn-helix domain-containing protein n=1 Tax=Trichococcus shcherbakoviae TaxID=2094020 RepID=UPI002AA92E23|nr:helix-turn-helix domain-containing protein [Trichococcus shcherbakoviae]
MADGERKGPGRPAKGFRTLGPEQIVEIERLYLQNRPIREIADRFGVAKGAIDYHLRKTIRPKLWERAEVNREVEYAKVDLLEKIAWERFEESKSPQRKVQIEKKSLQGLPDSTSPNDAVKAADIERDAIKAGVDPRVVKRVLTRVGRTGETSWLQIVQWCIDWRARIRGDYAAQKHEHQVVAASDLRIAGTTPEQFTEETLRELLAAIEIAEKKRQEQNVGKSDSKHAKQPDAGSV